MMKLNDIFKNTSYDDTLFSEDSITTIESAIFMKQVKGVETPYIKCLVREKEIKLTPEEAVRQLYIYKLIHEYGYPTDRIQLETPIHFGREVKRADITIMDKDRPTVPYIIVELKKPKLTEGKEQLKSYCNATGAPIGVWTNGEQVSCYNRKDPNFFEMISDIPKAAQKLSDKFDVTLQKTIKNLFDKAYQCRLNADSEFVSAEQMLISAIGFNDFEPDTNNVATKPFSESYAVTGRLDAEYYLPRYDSYGNKIGTEETVGSMCSLNDKNYAPNNETAYQYIELADVGYFGNIGEVEKVLGKDLPSRARRQVKTGQIIVASVEGSLQSCALITDEYDNALCSTGFYVLDSKRINSETLLVLFKSKPIQELLKQIPIETMIFTRS